MATLFSLIGIFRYRFCCPELFPRVHCVRLGEASTVIEITGCRIGFFLNLVPEWTTIAPLP